METNQQVTPMPTVVHSHSEITYTEVTPGATAWVWSDKPLKGTVLVTEHGLRRLLRLAKRAWGIGKYANLKSLPAETQAELSKIGMDKLYDRDVEPEKMAAFLNECCTIFCEGDLVMSRLFVDEQGRAIAHQDEEVDEASIPPWEKTADSTLK